MTELTHILDTSALLAHLLREPCSENVTALLLDPDVHVGISALSIVEVHAQMRVLGIERRSEEVLTEYLDLSEQVIPVDVAIAFQTVSLRQIASHRIPTIDAIIAATAAQHNAILVHRDAHFLAITDEGMRQQFLGEGDKGDE